MQSIFFFTVSFLAMAVVLYLGVTSIMKGFTAKQERRLENEAEEAKEIEKNEISSDNQNGLSSEINKLNELYKSGALSKEEFDKAKAKLLEN
jgi:predicted membrane protein